MEKNMVYMGKMYSCKRGGAVFHIVTHSTTRGNWLFGGTITTLCGREISNAWEPSPRYWGEDEDHRLCSACARLSKEKWGK